jgi:SMC interacting uncharacterized protein involved in chromosome segregation
MTSKDPRPLSDRSFQQAAISNLLDFFTTETPPFPLTVKFFEAPQRKDVFRLFESLLNILDPQLLKGLNVERDLPAIISAGSLPYPYTFPKSAFLAISAPTTWPHTLALLSWLADLARVSKPPAVEPATFAAYAAWMNERADKEEKQKAVAFREALAAAAQARAETSAAAEELKRLRTYGIELLNDSASPADAEAKRDEARAHVHAVLAEQEKMSREYSQEEHKHIKLRQAISTGEAKNEADKQESLKILTKLDMSREEVEEVQTRLTSAESKLARLTKASEALHAEGRSVTSELDAFKSSIEHKVKKLQTEDLPQVKFNPVGKTAHAILGIEAVEPVVKSQAETKQRLEAKLGEATKELDSLTQGLQVISSQIQAAEAETADKKAKAANLAEKLRGDFSTNPVERQVHQLEIDMVNEVSRTKSLEEAMGAVDRDMHEQLRRIATYSAEAAEVVSHHDARKAQDRAFFREKAATVEQSLSQLEIAIKERTDSARRAHALTEAKGVVAAPTEYRYNRIEFRY